MVFTKPLERRKIVERLRDLNARRVTVIGCPYCASISISKSRKLPIYDPRIALGTGSGIALETKELKEHLEAEGFDVNVRGTAPAPISFCFPGRWQKKMIPRWADEGDAVVALMCAGGRATVRTFSPKEIPVVPGVRDVGASNTVAKIKLFPFRIEIDGARSSVGSFAEERRKR